MKVYTGILPIALAVLNACAPSQAVVHGIQQLQRPYDPAVANRNGYRYNGPSHKYLPAASEPTTEAVTTTGHWLPNPVQPQQLSPYEHTYSGTTTPGYQRHQTQQQQDYLGPYNMQYYEREQPQQHPDPADSWQPVSAQPANRLNTFQYAANHQAAAGAAAGAERGEASGLSAGAEHDRYMGPGQRGAQLIGQALPERYQRQPFAGQQLDDSVQYMQMQSNSFELPPTYSMHREWPEPQSAPQFRPQQSHQREEEYEYPVQTQSQLQTQAQAQAQSLGLAQAQAHSQAQSLAQAQSYGQYAQFHTELSQQQPSYIQPNTFHVHAHSPTSQTVYYKSPSLEFEAPYY